MIDEQQRRITPWVGRLLAANAIVLLLQETVLTSDSLTQWLSFNSANALARPWTFVSYMFVHAGVLHLAANSLALFVFGPAVERRLGGAAFITYYLYCGVVAAIASMLLHAVGIGHVPADPGEIGIVGASGAIIGVAYAFSRIAPDSQLMVFPIPVPVRAQTLIYFLAAWDLAGLFVFRDGIAHEAHLGGLAAGILFFVLRGMSRPTLPDSISPPRQRVQVAAGSARRAVASGPTRASAATEPGAGNQPGQDETAEIDRVLDKISATGISSLTAEERRFLDSVARRRRDLPH